MVFTHWKLLPRTSVQARNNAEKSTPGTLKTVPGPFRNPPKSTPEAPKSTPERCKTRKNQPRATTNAAGSAKCVQEAPKSAKWCQHGPNMVPTLGGCLVLGPGGPPPYSSYNMYLQQGIKQVGLTRLGTATRCGGFWRGFGRPKTLIFAVFSIKNR